MASTKYIVGRLQKELLKKALEKTLNINSLASYGSGRQASVISLKRLEEKEFVIVSGEKIILTKKGMKALNYLEIEDINIKATKWLGTWHLVAYDIPEEKKKYRNVFRSKLKDLGFTLLQASLWVYPYECEEEIAIITEKLKLNDYVIYMKTKKIPREKSFKKRYELS